VGTGRTVSPRRMTRTGQAWSWLRKVGAWFSGVVSQNLGAARLRIGVISGHLSVQELAMKTPSFVEDDAKSLGQRRVCKANQVGLTWSGPAGMLTADGSGDIAASGGCPNVRLSAESALSRNSGPWLFAHPGCANAPGSDLGRCIRSQITAAAAATISSTENQFERLPAPSGPAKKPAIKLDVAVVENTSRVVEAPGSCRARSGG